MKLDYEITHQDNSIAILKVKNPFDNKIVFEQTIDYADLINTGLFNSFLKSAEMLLRKTLANEEILKNGKTQKVYELLSQLYQPNNYAEMLTKFEKFSEHLKGIEEFDMIIFFLQKNLKQ